MRISYTKEERDFFIKYVPGHSYEETQNEFIKRFKREITVDQVRKYVKNHHINNNLPIPMNRFQRGNVPKNKGSHITGNILPIGAERIWQRRNFKHEAVKYVWIKTGEPNIWKKKHIVVWENENGTIPDGMTLVFADGDTLNCDIGNLILIDRNLLRYMTRMEAWARFRNKEITETMINIAKVQQAAHKAKTRHKNAPEKNMP